eukprot:CAMPEP_0173390816 /NCGR_PEP_ID=MMETSP1356-20130122/16259_1 /TAXON_ID=77927 ORGANISM="Hemiselmis virescens, Strain PCC157" /NCGR_SAMPLE_ID=MMETSP1356 /ASSEMBLY_ACC=CAM_ASM_000847 /LENGTH=206 /DNA_ID=CAMNT_0014348295 /DNA_START=23 /DNA_END=643 /DNA_ORIENTATION=+
MADIKPRRPASARTRPEAASAPKEETAPLPAAAEDDGVYDDDETWLFAVQECMTTEDIAKMGFTNVILLNAARWRPEEGTENPEEAAAKAAAADAHYCFGIKGPVFETLKRSEKKDVEERLVAGMCGKGDVLIVIQNAFPSDASDPGTVMVGRLVDCIETAYMQASEDMVEDLAGVSVVLEKCASTPVLTCVWDDGTQRTLEVTET